MDSWLSDGSKIERRNDGTIILIEKPDPFFSGGLSECWLEVALEGGPGSGNFGHAGIPGQRGGSAPGGGLAAIGVPANASDEEKQGAVDAYKDKQKAEETREDVFDRKAQEMQDIARANGDDGLLARGNEYYRWNNVGELIAVDMNKAEGITLDLTADPEMMFLSSYGRPIGSSRSWTTEVYGRTVLDRPALKAAGWVDDPNSTLEALVRVKGAAIETKTPAFKAAIKGYEVHNLPAGHSFEDAKAIIQYRVGRAIPVTDCTNLSYETKRLFRSPANPPRNTFKAAEAWIEPAIEGGPGSGNFGHAGIPGQRGGSVAGGGLATTENRAIVIDSSQLSKNEQIAAKEEIAQWDMDPTVARKDNGAYIALAAIGSATLPEHHGAILRSTAGRLEGAVAYTERSPDTLFVTYLGTSGRMRGAGTQLMYVAAKQRAANTQQIQLAACPKATGFYQKLGFVDSGTGFLEWPAKSINQFITQYEEAYGK